MSGEGIATPADDPRLEVQDGFGTIVFDRPGSRVNLLTRDVMLRLGQLLTEVERRAAAGDLGALVIRSGKPENFIAGADIDELAALDDVAEAAELSRRGQALFAQLEALPVPTLAAIRGTCVGGGLELALACDHRAASQHTRTRLGLPEIRLGIVPALGGTVRLPRLVGLRNALDLILSGKQISTRRARSIGLVDRALAAESFDAAVVELARALASGHRPLPRGGRSIWTRWLQDGPVGRRIIASFARKQVQRETHGNYPAPPRALQITVTGLAASRDAAFDAEARAFGELAVTPVCKNLIAVFRLMEGAKKRKPAGAAREVHQAAVVGAGIMGAGIAELFACNEIPVRVVDVDDRSVRKGLGRAESLLERVASRREWSADDLRRRTDCLQGGTDYTGFEAVDLVIEAVVERMEVKREVFGRLEERVPPDAVIATNTSALSISELQEGLRRPGRVCGLHFFNPADRMPLVEVVRGSMSNDDALATAFAVASRLGKTPVVAKDRPGFVVNRILAAYLTEAGWLAQEGMELEAIDRTMRRFGMPMGPFRLLDEVGLDIVAEVSETLTAGLGDRYTPAPVVARVIETGRTGKKGGAGFYRYENGKSRGLDPEVTELIARERGDHPADPETAEERMVLIMVNEAARILEEEVVQEPADVDVAMIMGTGFPPFRGGLLRYADALGLDHIVQRLRAYADSVGPRFRPAAALERRQAFYGA